MDQLQFDVEQQEQHRDKLDQERVLQDILYALQYRYAIPLDDILELRIALGLT